MSPRQVPSYTILDPTVQDITQLVIRKVLVNDVPELQLAAYYDLKADTPGIRVDQEQESYSIQLAGAVKTSLVSFINANVTPGIKTQEGL